MRVPRVNPIAPNATIVEIGLHKLYFSYQTCVGYEGPHGKIRSESNYSRTTSKHLSAMGCSNFQPMKEELLATFISDALKEDEE